MFTDVLFVYNKSNIFLLGHSSKNANSMQREFLSTEELQSLNLHSAGQVKNKQI